MPAGTLWVDVYDASGNRLGAGPINTVMTAQIRRPLNGIGQFSFSVPATDGRAIDLLQNERRVSIFTSNADGSKRELGGGIIKQLGFSESASNMVRNIGGPDRMEELKRKNTWLARTYKQQTLSAVANDLIGLVSGWTVTVDSSVASELIEARFDGVSVLKALQYTVQQLGVHFRLGDGQVVEIGPFGDDDGRRINRVTQVGPDVEGNPLVLLVESLQATTKSEKIYNVLAPIGAGEGTAALTLENSTRSTPYTIQTDTMPDGTTLYYLQDSASVTAYGSIEKLGQFKDIAPLSNTDADIQNAANALYDAAVAWLERHKDPQDSYSAILKNVTEKLTPGDKLNVRYKGRVVNQDDETVDFVDLNQDMWLMEVTETVNRGGVLASVQLSSLDRYETTAADVVVGAIESINLRGLKPAQTSGVRSYVYAREMDSSNTAIVPVEFTDATLYVNRVRVGIKTTPLRATSTAAEGGGDHSHMMFEYVGTAGGSPGSYANFYARQTDEFDYPFMLPFPVGAGTDDVYTRESSGEHTHSLTYGIEDDTLYPQSIQVWVNGTNRTSALGGPFAPSNSAIDITLNEELMTDYLLNAAGGLRQKHEIEIRCGSGQGRVEVTVEISEVNQAINLL